MPGQKKREFHIERSKGSGKTKAVSRSPYDCGPSPGASTFRQALKAGPVCYDTLGDSVRYHRPSYQYSNQDYHRPLNHATSQRTTKSSSSTTQQSCPTASSTYSTSQPPATSYPVSKNHHSYAAVPSETSRHPHTLPTPKSAPPLPVTQPKYVGLKKGKRRQS